jgi:hypothetical protein
MSVLTELLASAGSWTGTSTLQDPQTSGPDPSTSTAEVTSVLDGRFARIDYTWSYRGKAQAGSLLLGYDEKSGEVTACWTSIRRDANTPPWTPTTHPPQPRFERSPPTADRRCAVPSSRCSCWPARS